MKKYFRILSAIILLSVLSACGTQDETVGMSGEGYGQEEYLQGDYVYVPEFYSFEQPDNINSSEIKLRGDKLYQYNYLYDLEARTAEDQFRILSLEGDVLLEIMVGGNGSEAQYSSEHLRTYDVDAEGNVYTVEAASGESADGGWINDYYLCCYNDSGSKVFSRDITADLKKDEDNLSVSRLLLDEEGRIYIMCGSTVKLFEHDGSPAGSILVVQTGSLDALTEGVSGDVYVFYSDWLSADNSVQGAKIDFETGKLAEEFGNLPDGGRSFCPGDKKDFFINTGSKVYEYDIEIQSYEEVFTWLDCDIMESNVRGIDRTEEGDLFAVTGDWSGKTMEVAFLRKVNISQVQPRTEIVLGLLYNIMIRIFRPLPSISTRPIASTV